MSIIYYDQFNNEFSRGYKALKIYVNYHVFCGHRSLYNLEEDAEENLVQEQ